MLLSGSDICHSRANRLEVYSAQPGENSLQLISTQTIYGNISALEKLRPASATTDHLFVLTDRSMHFTLHWDHAAKSLRTQTSVVDLSEFAQRDSLHEDRCHIDPASRFMSLEIHEGVIHVLPIARESKRVKLTAEPGTLGSATATRIPELGVKSSCFLHKRNAKDKPQLALLHTDASERTQIAVRELTFVYGNKDQPDNASFEDDPVQIVTGQVELGASHLISLAAPVYGFLVVGETSISYCDQWHFKLRTDPLPEATIFVAWTQIDEFRYLLADDYARLWILMIETNHKNDYDGFQIEIIGETARASTLVYLNDGIVFLGSHNSDSQLLRIGDRSVEILQTFSNLAPIIDFTIMDMGNRSSEAQVNEYSSGQARLVTGSGAYSDGSLRSIRSGVGVDDLGTIAAMHNVTDLFGLSLDASSRGCDTLLVSFVTHSRAFTISNEGELEEVDTLCDLDLSDSTILADSASPDRLVHVSPSLVTLCDTRQDSILATWRPDSSIVAATLMRSTGSSMLLTSIAGAGLVSIRIIDDRLDVTKVTDFGASLQISCIATSPLFPDLAVVGFWQDSSISILNLETHEVVKSIVVDEEEAVAELVVPRSLAIAKMASIGAPTLFVGLANGEVVSYSISRQKPDTIALADRKSTILGNQQAQLKVLREAESQHEQVVALCEHPSLIYGSEGRLVYSAITAEEATCVCTLDNEAFPGAMAMATKDELKLATIDREKTTHVQTLAVGKTVRRLAYSAHFKAFLLGTIKRTLQNQVEQVESHVELVDEVAFKSVAAYALHQDELIGSCIRAELNEGLDEPVQRFVVGTQYIETAEPALHRGRLLIFEVSEDRKLKVVSETKLKGACHCLAMCQGKIVAGLMKSVRMLRHDKHNADISRLSSMTWSMSVAAYHGLKSCKAIESLHSPSTLLSMRTSSPCLTS